MSTEAKSLAASSKVRRSNLKTMTPRKAAVLQQAASSSVHSMMVRQSEETVSKEKLRALIEKIPQITNDIAKAKLRTVEGRYKYKVGYKKFDLVCTDRATNPKDYPNMYSIFILDTKTDELTAKCIKIKPPEEPDYAHVDTKETVRDTSATDYINIEILKSVPKEEGLRVGDIKIVNLDTIEEIDSNNPISFVVEEPVFSRKNRKGKKASKRASQKGKKGSKKPRRAKKAKASKRNRRA